MSENIASGAVSSQPTSMPSQRLMPNVVLSIPRQTSAVMNAGRA